MRQGNYGVRNIGGRGERKGLVELSFFLFSVGCLLSVGLEATGETVSDTVPRGPLLWGVWRDQSPNTKE